jgi:hypothetical protein
MTWDELARTAEQISADIDSVRAHERDLAERLRVIRQYQQLRAPIYAEMDRRRTTLEYQPAAPEGRIT